MLLPWRITFLRGNKQPLSKGTLFKGYWDIFSKNLYALHVLFHGHVTESNLIACPFPKLQSQLQIFAVLAFCFVVRFLGTDARQPRD